MNFIKNNKILFGAFSLTALLALVMISLDIWMYSQFGRNKEEVDAKIAEYVELSKKTPAPTKKNINTITYEYKTIQKRLNRLQRQFGKYLRNPFLHFCTTLLNVPVQQKDGAPKLSDEELAGSCEDELLEAFRKYCDELPKDRKMTFNGQTDAENFVEFADKVLVPMVSGKLALSKNKNPEKPDKARDEEAKQKIQAALQTFEAEIKKIVPLEIVNTQLYSASDAEQTESATAVDDKSKKTDDKSKKTDDKSKKTDDKSKKDAEKAKNDEAFKKRVQNVARTNGYQYLMEAMGLPRTVDIGRFQAQLKMAKSSIRQNGLIPGIETIEKESDRDELINSITFRESDMPVQSRVFYLVRQMQIRFDIFRRFKKVLKIEKFTSFSPLEGEKKAERFSRYVFEITFLAEMATIREIMNKLLGASEENVCYNILYAQFSRPVPEDIDSVLAVSRFSAPQNAQQEQNPERNGNEGGNMKEGFSEMDVLAVGRDPAVRTVLKFEVLVFTGEDIARTGLEAK